MKLETVAELCDMMADQLFFQSTKGDFNSDMEVIADMLHDISEQIKHFKEVKA